MVRKRVPIPARTSAHNGRTTWVPVAGEIKKKICHNALVCRFCVSRKGMTGREGDREGGIGEDRVLCT